MRYRVKYFVHNQDEQCSRTCLTIDEALEFADRVWSYGQTRSIDVIDEVDGILIKTYR